MNVCYTRKLLMHIIYYNYFMCTTTGQCDLHVQLNFHTKIIQLFFILSQRTPQYERMLR